MKKSSENITGFFHWITQHNPLSINYIYSFSCVSPVKLKNLKANHNPFKYVFVSEFVVYLP